MAFLTNEDMTLFLRDMWPSRLRRAIKLDPETVDRAEWHQILPTDSLPLSQFLRVEPLNWPDIKDRTRPYIVTTAPDINEDTGEESKDLFEFKFRVQGFLGPHNLGHLGTWEGKPLVERAARAVQYVELHGGNDEDCGKIWAETIERVNHMGDVIANMVRVDNYEPMFDPKKGKLYFQRRIFKRAKPESGAINTPVPPQVSHLKNEIFAAARHGWTLNVNQDLFGKLSKNGYLQRAANFPFEEGQFVDITAAIDIVRRDNKPLAVKLRLDRIVLLDAAGISKKKVLRELPPVVKQRAELVFYEADEDGPEDAQHEPTGDSAQTAQHGDGTPPANEAAVGNSDTTVGGADEHMIESD